MFVNLVYPFTATYLDYPDDESLAITILFCGCNHFCKNCHNQELQNYNYQKGTKVFYIDQFINELKNVALKYKTSKIVLQGGDPLFKTNIDFTRRFLEKVSNYFDVCLYTGYSLEDIKKNDIKGYTFLKTGTYNENLKQDSEKTDDYIQFASTNQRLYDSDNTLISDNGKYYFKRG